ncbi:glycosyltransferase [Elusimicrobiota bacterium]
MKKTKKILLVYGARDSGHAQAAQAISGYLSERKDIEVVEDDIASYFPRLGPLFLKLYVKLIVAAPGLWGYFHGNVEHKRFTECIERIFCKLDLFRADKMLKRHNPDVIVATHAFAMRVILCANRKSGKRVPVFAVVTDFRAHVYWASDQVDGYFVPTNEARLDLMNRGIAREKIIVSGMPVRKQFLKDVDKARARIEIGLDPEMSTVLIMGGSYGIFPYIRLAKMIMGRPGSNKRQWIFACGNNEQAYKEVSRITRGHDAVIRTYGFTRHIPLLMDASDLIVTKAGAVSICEAQAKGLPIVISGVLSGQERKNAQYLLKEGSVISADNFEVLGRLLKGSAIPDGLRAKTEQFARPESGRLIAGKILGI